MFETGTNRWRHYDAWPPAGSKEKAFYFRADAKLSPTAPSEDSEACRLR